MTERKNDGWVVHLIYLSNGSCSCGINVIPHFDNILFKIVDKVIPIVAMAKTLPRSTDCDFRNLISSEVGFLLSNTFLSILAACTVS